MFEDWNDDDSNFESEEDFDIGYQEEEVEQTFRGETENLQVSDAMFSLETEENLMNMFSLLKIKEQRIKQLLCSNDMYLMLTTLNNVIRFKRTAEMPELIEFPKAYRGMPIHKIFLDPTGIHAIVSFESKYNFYLGAARKKPRELQKLRTFLIEAVDWGTNASLTSTGSILVGTSCAKLFEVMVDASEKKVSERKVSCLMDFNRLDHLCGSVMDIAVFPFKHDRHKKLIFILTGDPVGYFYFVGGPSYEDVFRPFDVAAYRDANLKFSIFPGGTAHSRITSYYEPSQGTFIVVPLKEHYCRFRLHLTLEQQNTVEVDTMVGEYPESDSKHTEDCLGIAMTRFHYSFLYPSRLVVANRLKLDYIVFQERFDTDYVPMRAIIKDSGSEDQSIFITSQNMVYELVINREDREMWKLYLDCALEKKCDFEIASKYAHEKEQKDTIQLARAKFYFEQGKYKAAAKHYAESICPFEEAALKFQLAEELEALDTFVKLRMEKCDPDSNEMVVLCTWLLEIYLSQLSKMECAGTNDKIVKKLVGELRDFIWDHATYLDRKTSFQLLAGHGRTEEYNMYAEAVKDYSKVVSFHMQNGDMRSALKILNKASAAEATPLFVRFAPDLFKDSPSETVSTLMSHMVKPHDLIPALVAYNQRRIHDRSLRKSVKENFALSYLLHYIDNRIESGANSRKDRTIHNLVIAMFVDERQEHRLMSFMRKQFRLGEPLFDKTYALRKCMQRGLKRAAVYLCSQMKMYGQAILIALQASSYLHDDQLLFSEESGFICSKCKVENPGKRFCCHSCNDDICWPCLDSSELVEITCKLHRHPLKPDDKMDYTCDRCKRRNVPGRYKCEECHVNLCLKCIKHPKESEIIDVVSKDHPHNYKQWSFNCIRCSKSHYINPDGSVRRHYCPNTMDSICPQCIQDSVARSEFSEVTSACHKHPLFLMERTSNFTCLICSQHVTENHQGGASGRYHCEECNFDVCAACVGNSDVSEFHPSWHDHSFKVEPYYGYTCRGCDKERFSERYRCEQHCFDLCADCLHETEVIDIICHDLHEHQLSQIDNDGGRECDEKATEHSEITFACKECNYSVCASCLFKKMPKDINTHIHEHSLRRSSREKNYSCAVCHKQDQPGRHSCSKSCGYDVCGICVYGALNTKEIVEEAISVVRKAEETSTENEIFSNEGTNDDVKRLWLFIAKYLIEVKKDIKMAVDLLDSDRTGCTLKIEDVLQFFPDDVLVDEFKRQIVNSLRNYRHSIKGLKEEMGMFTKNASDIKKDIGKLDDRFGYVSANQRCEICGGYVLNNEFYLFPCLHSFHSSCLKNEMMTKHLSNKRLAELRALEQDIASDSPSLSKRNLQQKIDKIIACDCILCGDVMIKSITQPFIDENDQETIDKWLI
eukprot:TRINITY_DN2123_c0_g2_i1.p1 TRINITY_DN2123_c0_g2~~TRINITY_DN2123_c0_g2_i1.p1  ORF type:complete len:1389 (+),score=367.44 TRINITY_DN2123_c0_g2_i1:171-4337(+)